ncbi:MAG: B12-binding domain-containing radical SAM protein [Firmicutes bacterium HGW-Firmicutes-15]|nr:MAG: B12-binding domain-containing radical SAM protein [Firmicutes bacterium HGW-Firmicutes-15]
MRILLVAYDNDSYISWFPQGLAYIASACLKAGHEVNIYNQDVYHWPESHLTDLLNKERYDFIGVSACGGYYQYRKVLKISEAINNSKYRPFYVLGGHLCAPEPDYFLRKTLADAIVIGEGEITVINLLDALEHKQSLHSVNGIAFLENSQCIQTPRQALIADIDNIPFPAWDLFPIDHYALLRVPNMKNSERCMPVLSGRGCTFKCNFCYRLDQGFRGRSADSIVDEIKILKEKYAISYIIFSDELLMSSSPRTVELCESFIRNKLNIRWDCNGRLNYAKPDVLKLMKEAGCVFINYGIESMDEQALRNMNKALTVKQIISGIENTLAVGISPGFNIIFGNIGETAESLRLGVEFLLKYDDHAQMRTIRPVTPYPGCPLYYYAIEKGLVKDCADFYEHKHVNSDLQSVNFTNLSDDDFHRLLYEANQKLILNYYSACIKNTDEVLHKLYIEKDRLFRGFRQS